MDKRSNKEDIIFQLNNRKYSDLSDHFKGFIKYMFPNVKDSDLVLCDSYNGSKIDLTVTVNCEIKNISVKKGNVVCLYKDRVINLIVFLMSINVSRECLLSLLAYHYADGTYDGSGKLVSSYGQMLKQDYKEQIDIVNNEFKNKELLSKVLDFVLINERRGKRVDYFYHGDSRNGKYASADVVKYNILNDSTNYRRDFMRIGVMNFMPVRREVAYSDRSSYLKHFCVLRLNIKRHIKK